MRQKKRELEELEKTIMVGTKLTGTKVTRMSELLRENRSNGYTGA